jgi:hypothetical protein
MTCTVAQLLPDVRKVLDVTEDGYADEDLAQNVAEAFREMWRERAASRYVGCRIASVDFPSDMQELLSFEVSFDERWRLGIVYFAAARCYEQGITDSVNLQLAQTLKQQAAAVFRS